MSNESELLEIKKYLEEKYNFRSTMFLVQLEQGKIEEDIDISPLLKEYLIPGMLFQKATEHFPLSFDYVLGGCFDDQEIDRNGDEDSYVRIRTLNKEVEVQGFPLPPFYGEFRKDIENKGRKRR